MDNQKIKKIIRVIARAGALIVGESPLLQAAVTFEPTGDPHNEVVFANWHDAEGYEHAYHFQEIALDNAEIKGNTLLLREEGGLEVLIEIFELSPVDVLKEMGQ
jgi:hypothetical protein